MANLANQILQNHNKLGASNAATVLIVGAEGSGKHVLATALVSLDTPFSLQVRVTCSLPLPIEKSSTRPKIDLIVFLINLASRQSYRVVEKALEHIDVGYFIGKTCFLTTNGGLSSTHHVESDTVRELADNYGSAVLNLSLQDPQSVQAVAQRIYSMLEIAAGFRKNVTSLLIDSTRVPYSTQE